jgi:NADH-quinone oxidoreductase subunit N
MLPAEQIANLHRLAPEIALCAFGILIMVLDPFVEASKQKLLGWVAFVGALCALAGVQMAAWFPGLAYSGLMRVDAFSLFVHVVVIAASGLAILGSVNYLEDEGIQRGEYYALVLFATAGMGILAGANELVTAFLGLEMSSISTYILAGFRRRAVVSNEASLKYFILG